MAKGNAERCKSSKDKKKESGLVRKEVWIKPEYEPDLREHEARWRS